MEATTESGCRALVEEAYGATLFQLRVEDYTCSAAAAALQAPVVAGRRA